MSSDFLDQMGISDERDQELRDLSQEVIEMVFERVDTAGEMGGFLAILNGNLLAAVRAAVGEAQFLEWNQLVKGVTETTFLLSVRINEGSTTGSSESVH